MKKWYTSKTIWFNIITIVLGIIQVISNSYAIPSEILATINGVGNLILRVITSTSITNNN